MYDELRGAIKSAGMHQYELAHWLGITNGALSFRMKGETPWPIEDCYKVLAFLGREPEEIIDLFPPNGKAVERKQRDAQYLSILSALRDACTTLTAQIESATT